MANEAETAGLLGAVPLFGSLSPAELEALARVAVPRTFEQGEAIVREGERSDTCFVIRKGRVRVTRGRLHGRALTLAELREGSFFGELAVFDGETRSATVEAIEPTSVLAILADDMRRLLRTHPDTAQKMLAALADRVRAANERLARRSFQSVQARLASELLAQVESLQMSGAPAHDVLVAATQKDIAQLAGSSRESASRFLAELERAGLVTTGRGRVVVHEPAALRGFIG